MTDKTDPYAGIGVPVEDPDPYAAISDPVPDPYAGIGVPVESVSGAAPKAPAVTARREAGIGARSLLEGAGGLADLPGNLIAGTDKLGKYIADHIRKLFGAEPSTAAMDYTNPATAAASQAADAMNLPSA